MTDNFNNGSSASSSSSNNDNIRGARDRPPLDFARAHIGAEEYRLQQQGVAEDVALEEIFLIDAPRLDFELARNLAQAYAVNPSKGLLQMVDRTLIARTR